MKTLVKDPLNIVIVGVAGQGNVVTSTLICNALIKEGHFVTFGQSYPSAQRGGSVINFIRVSEKYQCSPIVPRGKAHIIAGMEPVETLRMLAEYGNPEVVTVVNIKPMASVDTTVEKLAFPPLDKLLEHIADLSAKTIIINATDEGVGLLV